MALPPPASTPKPRNGNGLKAQIIGIYEREDNGDILRQDYLANGIMEEYNNGEKLEEYKWEIINGEVHIKVNEGIVRILNFSPEDSSLTVVKTIRGFGFPPTLTALPIDEQPTFIKIPEEPVGGATTNAPTTTTNAPASPSPALNLPAGKQLQWTYATGQPTDLDRVYLTQPINILTNAFGMPSGTQASGQFGTWFYDKMKVYYQGTKYTKINVIVGQGRVVGITIDPRSAQRADGVSLQQ